MDLIGLIAALTAVIIIVSRWQQVPLALTAGIFIIIITSSMNLESITTIIVETALNPRTLELVAVVLLITLLSSIMHSASLLKRMLNSLISLFKNIQLLIVMVPAFVGLLAMPGGAIISAPMVSQLGNKIRMPEGAKSAANVYFRHLSLFFNPLSPLLILAADISGLGFAPLIKFHAVPVLISVTAGFIIMSYFWPKPASDVITKEKDEKGVHFLNDIKEVLLSSSPLVLGLTLALAFGVNFAAALFLAVLLAVLLDAASQKKINLERIKNFATSGINWNMGLTVFTILLFGAFIQKSEGIVYLAEYVAALDMPTAVLVLLTSLIVGFTSGHPMVGAAILYPVFIPLVGTGIESSAYLALIFTGLVKGYLFSPIHLCLIVSNEYFKIGFKESYPLLLTLIAALLLPAFLIAFLI